MLDAADDSEPGLKLIRLASRLHAVTAATAATAAAAAVLAMVPGPTMASADPSWSQPQDPFRIVGDIYYVGSRGLGAYLIVSPEGDILLDGTLPDNARMVEHNVERLGLRLRDIKILLTSHAHFDHVGAMAQIKRDTGAALVSSAGDRWALEHGVSRGDNTADLPPFPQVRVDRLVADGETVRLGKISMTATLTPGHTPGCTTWVTRVNVAGATRTVVFPCSLTVAGNVLVGNRAYPSIVKDYQRSFARLRAMRADIVLPAHPGFADVLQRHARDAAGVPNAFVAPDQLAKIADQSAAEFSRELTRQQAAAGRQRRAGPAHNPAR